uniref:Uncharacterized protein n=1 Tax=Anguilla anguilla TaxID=7936 RepID=A0A0E9SST0_ANGAN
MSVVLRICSLLFVLTSYRCEHIMLTVMFKLKICL